MEGTTPAVELRTMHHDPLAVSISLAARDGPCSAAAWARTRTQRHRCVALPPHAAHGRGRPRLRGGRRRAARVRALPAAAARGAGPLAAHARARARALRPASRAAAAPERPASTRLRGRRGPRHAARQHRPPARGGLRLPRRHRQPPGVHRPLPQGLAADARGQSEGRGAGARYRQDGRFDRFGYYDLSSPRSSRRTGSSRVGRGGKYNRIKTFHEWTLEPDARRHAAGVRLRDRAAAADATASSRRCRGRRGWFRRNSGKALRRLRGILEEDRDRGARATVGGLD